MASASNSATPAALLALRDFGREGGSGNRSFSASRWRSRASSSGTCPFRFEGWVMAVPRRGRAVPGRPPVRGAGAFHGLDGDAEAVGDLRLGNFVDLVHDENGLAARRKRGDGVDQCLELALGLMATHGRRRHAGDFRKLGDGFHPGGSTTVATIAAHGGVVGDFPQQGQGRVHVLLLVAFEQLHARRAPLRAPCPGRRSAGEHGRPVPRSDEPVWTTASAWRDRTARCTQERSLAPKNGVECK